MKDETIILFEKATKPYKKGHQHNKRQQHSKQDKQKKTDDFCLFEKVS